MAKIKSYNTEHTYTLKNIKYTTTSGSATTTHTMEDIVDLTASNAIIGLQREALSGENAEYEALKKEMVNYAYYSLRNQIEAAANSGQSFVDIRWEKLIQNPNTSKLETFLGLAKNDSGNGYKKWTTAAQKWPWGTILKEINGTGAKDLVAVGYLYDPNETVPYAVRLSWRSDSQPDDDPTNDTGFNANNYQTSNTDESTNKDIQNGTAEHPYYIIKKNPTILIDDTTAIANTNDSSTSVGQVGKIQHFIDIISAKIEGASMAGDNYVCVYWGDFDSSLQDAIAKMLINSKDNNHKGNNLYVATDNEVSSNATTLPPKATVKFKEAINLYADVISPTAHTWEIPKNKEWTNLLDGLFGSDGIFNLYDWQWLVNATSKTIDGFVIAWASNKATATAKALEQRQAYRTNTTPEAPDNNVYISSMTAGEITTEQSNIYKALHSKHLSALVNNIQGGLLASYQGMDEAVAITWGSIDGGLTSKEMFQQFKKIVNISYSGPIVKPGDTPTEHTVIIKANGKTPSNADVTGYIGALKLIFGSFIRVIHSSTVTDNSSASDIKVTIGNAQFPTGTASFSSGNIYWDYIYYKNTYGKHKTEDGKVKWATRANHIATGGGSTSGAAGEVQNIYSTTPCGIVVQLGSTSDCLKSIIKDYADTPDPSKSYNNTTAE